MNFYKFIIVGGTGTFVNMGVLWLLKGVLGFPIWLAGILAIEISILNNFTWNNFWTFRKSTNKAPIYMKFFKYNLSVVVGIGINYTTLLILSHLFKVQYLIANFIGILLATMSNYLFSSRWAWKDE